MAKTIKEHIEWYSLPETRPWKRKVQFVEIVFFALSVMACLISFAVYEGPKKYETMFYLFGGCLLACTLALSRFMLLDTTVSRYIRWFILLGLIAGIGLLALSGFMIMVNLKNAV